MYFDSLDTNKTWVFHPRYGVHVSNCGDVLKWRTKSKRFRKLSGTVYKNGYLFYTVGENYKDLRITAHRLVAECFLPNEFNKPQVNHIDGNKLNNSAANLEWVTASENMTHRSQTLNKGRGSNNGMAKLVESDIAKIRVRLNGEDSLNKIARSFGVSKKLVLLIKQNKIWKHVSIGGSTNG